MDTCQRCLGTKHVQDQDGKWVRCECLEAEIEADKLAKAGIPAYAVALTFAKVVENHGKCAGLMPDVKAFVDAATSKARTRGLMLYGLAGSGKAALSALIACRAARAGLTVKVAQLGDLVRDVMDGDSEKAKGNLLAEVIDADLSILRLGLEPEHKYNGWILERVHNGRKAADRPTLYTSRVGTGEWERRYGDVTMRLFWTAAGDVVVLDLDMGRKVVC
jgi:DNA replication protein DnaC